MSDNRRRYQVILKAIKELYPGEPRGNLARHLHTLAALISGIVGSKSTNLPDIAGKVPDGTKTESRVKKFYRWLKNQGTSGDLYFLPFAEALLESLANTGPLPLVVDGSDIGRNCVVLLVSVIYKKRSLPIAWIVVQGKKGHFPEDTHLQLVERVHAIVPEDATVIFLGDGEFDGIGLQAAVEGYGWKYVFRTAKNVRLEAEGDEFSFEELHMEPGDCLGLFDVLFTLERYGPVSVIVQWRIGCKEPIYLVTNMELTEEACYWYSKRYRIETFFSDQKSRGFNLHKSHISDPARLARLMIAACLAYIWIVYLGVVAKRDDWVGIIHRPDRCDLSLFRLGLLLLDHFLDECLPIPVAFQMPCLVKSVR